MTCLVKIFKHKSHFVMNKSLLFFKKIKLGQSSEMRKKVYKDCCGVEVALKQERNGDPGEEHKPANNCALT